MSEEIDRLMAIVRGEAADGNPTARVIVALENARIWDQIDDLQKGMAKSGRPVTPAEFMMGFTEALATYILSHAKMEEAAARGVATSVTSHLLSTFATLIEGAIADGRIKKD